MDINLSNNVVKSYLKRDNEKIAVHLKSDLLIKTNKYFNSEELNNISGNLKLSNGLKIVLDRKSWVVSKTEYDYDYDINKSIKVIQFHLYSILDFIVIPNCVVDISIKCTFSSEFSNPEIILKGKGLFKKYYDERRFMSFDKYTEQLNQYNIRGI